MKIAPATAILSAKASARIGQIKPVMPIAQNIFNLAWFTRMMPIRHAKDNQHGQIGPQCLSSLDEITGTLQSSVSMFLSAMIMMHGYIGFGPAMDHALEGFKNEFARLYGSS